MGISTADFYVAGDEYVQYIPDKIRLNYADEWVFRVKREAKSNLRGSTIGMISADSFEDEDAIMLQVSSDMQTMLNLVNKERTSRGLSALCFNSKLNQAALAHSIDMRNKVYFSHTGADGSHFSTRIRRAGYPRSSSAENIATSRSVEKAHRNLMNSPGHNRNILYPAYKHIGLGITKYTSGRYRGYYVVTQVFGSARSEGCSSSSGGGGGGNSWQQFKTFGQCMGIKGSSGSEKKVNVARVIMETCQSAWRSQKWRLDSSGRLVNLYTGKCLEAGPRGNKWDKAFVWSCHSGQHQKWRKLSNGRYQNARFTSRYLGLQYCGERSDRRAVELSTLDTNRGNCRCAQIWNKGCN